MGRKTTVEYYDDMTGDTEGNVKPVVFGYDHVWYEIDLNESHRTQLQAALAPWQKKARPLLRIPKGGPRRYTPKPVRRIKHSGMHTAALEAIRVYTLARHGVELRKFGRIAHKWIELWQEAGCPSVAQIRGEQPAAEAVQPQLDD